jgi:hypothetical protein
VEIRFAKTERDVIARGVFTSVADLRRKLMRCIRRCNRQPRPIRRTHSDTKRRISSASGSSEIGHW